MPPEMYLELENAAERRSEYLDGIMYGMAGGSTAHTFLATSVSARLLIRLEDRGCRVGTADFRVMVKEAGPYFYPDCVVLCGGSSSPVLIVEVLSKLTATFDRGEKFRQYQRLGWLREYVLISQSERRIEVFRRSDEGSWSSSVYTDVCRFESVDCEIPLAEIYRNIELSNAE